MFGIVFIGIGITRAIFYYRDAYSKNRYSLNDIVDSSQEQDSFRFDTSNYNGSTSSMYTIVPVNWLETKFDVYHDNMLIGKITNEVPWFKTKSLIQINDTTYIALRESLCGKWFLTSSSDKAVIASATKPGFFIDKFIIQYNTQQLVLHSPQLSVKNYFVINRNNSEIGRIKRTSLLSTKWSCEMKEELPFEIVLFILYLSRIVVRNRSAYMGNNNYGINPQ